MTVEHCLAATLISPLSNILALRPVSFSYKSGGDNIGFIAQEMEAVYPDVIDNLGDCVAMKSITGWDKTSARLVKAIQELSSICDSQQSLIETLTARLEAIERRLS